MPILGQVFTKMHFKKKKDFFIILVKGNMGAEKEEQTQTIIYLLALHPKN